jgi:hypothetical protein
LVRARLNLESAQILIDRRLGGLRPASSLIAK